MPTRTGLERAESSRIYTVPIHLPVMNQVFSSNGAGKISPNSPVARPRQLAGNLKYSFFWLLRSTFEVVAVALSHAAILEESMRARDLLMEQNIALDLGRSEAETANRARNEFCAYRFVKDSGSGINPQDIPKLFTECAQTQTSATRNSGCDVTAVSLVDELLHVTSQGHKVVFMDVSMPGIDGYELAVRIHEKFTKRHEQPVLVALTGCIDKMTKENCMRVAMDGVILKP
ncbi:hypothetical protein ACFX13_038950 [Malus domestica]|uniref:Response regulatory domain-containing protein n=1 Tax=Malus domestica TaxID=3750 RepID=A0A498JPW5_MALDO|nr:hypothetical protein DVH24_008132 [Malus domestica]